MKRLETLAKSAVGFDSARGDQFQISASAFNRPPEPDAAKLSFLDSPRIMRIAQLVGGVILLIIAALAISRMRALASSSSTTNMAHAAPGGARGRAGSDDGRGENALPGMPPRRRPSPPGRAIRTWGRVTAPGSWRATIRRGPPTCLKAWINTDSEQRS